MIETDREPAQPVFAFGTFEFFPRMRVLRDRGRHVPLGSRAVELLTALVERAGDLAPVGELMARAWPTTTVVEANLRVQIAGLRKVLADGHADERFIATAPGLGYRFVAPVRERAAAPESAPLAPPLKGNLPAPLTRLFGRARVIEELRRRLTSQRLVTIVGPGGVGKTSVAVAAAHDAALDSAWFVDLAPVSDPGLLRTALLEAFGLSAAPENLLAAVARRFDGASALLVLDNCEHLIEACAWTAEAMLGAASGLRILATGREPLRAAEEWVYRLPPLDIPSSEATLERAVGCSAVQLFVDRATASDNRFSLEEATLAPVVDICRRLDGIPLALELAAATVATLGVGDIAQRLRDQLDLPRQGRRLATPRQATLRGTLEWSYRLLTPAEQQTLRRLAVFQGGFTLESALVVSAQPGADEGSILESLVGLVAKSLLSVDIGQETTRYRLLQTTRAYALELQNPREAVEARVRHAGEMRRLANGVDAAWGEGDGAQARRDSADLIDDLGAAIEWALSPPGDIETAVDLLVAAAPLRRRLSLARDHRKQVVRALDQVRALAPPNPAAEMRLLGSYCFGAAFRYATRDWIIAEVERLQALALELGDAGHLMAGLWDRAIVAHLLGDNPTLELCADRLAEAATSAGHPAYRALAHNLSSIHLMKHGDIAQARRENEAGLALDVGASGEQHIARLGVDPTIYLYDLLVGALWAQGFPLQALAAARACVAHSRKVSHAQSLMYALVSVGAPAALFMGDADAASVFLDESGRLCEDRSERGYIAWGQEFMEGVLRVERTGFADPAAAALVAAGSTNPSVGTFPLLAVRIAEAVGLSHSPKEGLAAIEMISPHVPVAYWAWPELQRVRAVLLRMAGESPPRIEPVLREALARASEIGALSLELRIVTTLAELLSDEGKVGEALSMLTGVMDRVTEGRDAADYQRAASVRKKAAGP